MRVQRVAQCVLALVVAATNAYPAVAQLHQGPYVNLTNVGAFVNFRYALPRSILSEAVRMHAGDGRLRRFVARWLSGEPLRIGIVGGSVANGVKASVVGKLDFFSLVTQALNSALPGAQVSSRNSAFGAAGPLIYLQCFDNYVDQNVDLLFVEFNFKDVVDTDLPIESSGYVRIRERLIRRTLSMATGPAFVPLFLHRWKVSGFLTHFDYTPQTYFETLAEYYGLSYVNTRQMLFMRVRNNLPGFIGTEIYAPDAMHPNDAGHRIIADSILHLLERVAKSMVAEVHPAPLNLTALSGQRSPLPPPMLDGDEPPYQLRQCANKTDLTKYAIARSNFTYVVTEPGVYGVTKSGFRSTVAGAFVRFQLNTTLPEAFQNRTVWSNRTLVYVGYMRGSLLPMGRMSISCVQGCACTPLTINAAAPGGLITAWASLSVTQADACVIQATVLNSTTSGGYTSKVNTLSVLAMPVKYPESAFV